MKGVHGPGPRMGPMFCTLQTNSTVTAFLLHPVVQLLCVTEEVSVQDLFNTVHTVSSKQQTEGIHS